MQGQLRGQEEAAGQAGGQLWDLGGPEGAAGGLEGQPWVWGQLAAPVSPVPSPRLRPEEQQLPEVRPGFSAKARRRRAVKAHQELNLARKEPPQSPSAFLLLAAGWHLRPYCICLLSVLLMYSRARKMVSSPF